MKEIISAIAEIQQSRSEFQLDRFVIGAHPTPEMQYYQTCLELNDLIYKYELAKLSVRKSEIKIEKLRASGDELDEIEAQEIELGLIQTKIAMTATEREIEHLSKIYDSFEVKYTREQIEAAQPEYWKARLVNNAKAMLMGGVSVNAAHIETMKQAGILEEFIEEVQKSKKELGL